MFCLWNKDLRDNTSILWPKCMQSINKSILTRELFLLVNKRTSDDLIVVRFACFAKYSKSDPISCNFLQTSSPIRAVASLSNDIFGFTDSPTILHTPLVPWSIDKCNLWGNKWNLSLVIAHLGATQIWQNLTKFEMKIALDNAGCPAHSNEAHVPLCCRVDLRLAFQYPWRNKSKQATVNKEITLENRALKNELCIRHNL